MKTKHLIAGCLLVSTTASAQEVVSTQGDSYTNASGSIDYTIGEVVIQTGTDGSNYITQGFHQTNWNFAGLEDSNPDFQATVYPNPTEDFLNIKVPVYENVSYKVFDANGKIVMENGVSEEVTELQVAGLAPGAYSVTLYNNSNHIKTFKLIKQQ